MRSIIYQLFCIFRYIYGTTTKVIYKPTERNYDLEIVVRSSRNKNLELVPQHHRYHKLNKEMFSNKSPGPGDPLLARQKQHHRRAFEYISKALKIDEENEGELLFIF